MILGNRKFDKYTNKKRKRASGSVKQVTERVPKRILFK